jgi:DNA polymerase III subunit gamma/tau
MKNLRNDWLEKYRPKQWADFYYGVHDEPIRTAIDQIQSRKYQNLLLAGDFGLGKTSYARVLGARTQCLQYRQHAYEPCGTCEYCITARRGGGGTVDERYHEMNAAEKDFMKDLQKKLGDLRGRISNPASEPGLPYLLAVDEFHAVRLEDQTALLKDLENEQYVCFLLLTSHDAEVHRAIQSRTVKLSFLPPNKAQYLRWIERICKAEGITYEMGALEELYSLTNGLPREVVKYAQRLQMRQSHWTVPMVRDVFGHGTQLSNPSSSGGTPPLAY